MSPDSAYARNVTYEMLLCSGFRHWYGAIYRRDGIDQAALDTLRRGLREIGWSSGDVDRDWALFDEQRYYHPALPAYRMVVIRVNRDMGSVHLYSTGYSSGYATGKPVPLVTGYPHAL